MAHSQKVIEKSDYLQRCGQLDKGKQGEMVKHPKASRTGESLLGLKGQGGNNSLSKTQHAWLYSGLMAGAVDLEEQYLFQPTAWQTRIWETNTSVFL